jgi:hypothetical protein
VDEDVDKLGFIDFVWIFCGWISWRSEFISGKLEPIVFLKVTRKVKNVFKDQIQTFLAASKLEAEIKQSEMSWKKGSFLPWIAVQVHVPCVTTQIWPPSTESNEKAQYKEMLCLLNSIQQNVVASWPFVLNQFYQAFRMDKKFYSSYKDS